MIFLCRCGLFVSFALAALFACFHIAAIEILHGRDICVTSRERLKFRTATEKQAVADERVGEVAST